MPDFYTPDEIYQKIEDINFNLDELSKDPERFGAKYLSNLVREVLGVQVGYDGSKLRLIRVTSAGALQVNVASASYDNYSYDYLTCAGVYALKTFSGVQKELNLESINAGSIIKLSSDGIVFGDEITIYGGQAITLPLNVLAMQYKEQAVGVPSWLTVLGFY